MYFFDTYSLFEIIRGNENYEKYKEFPIVVSVLNVAELYWGLLKEKDKAIADRWCDGLNFDILGIDRDSITEAVLFRYKYKKEDVSLADSVGYILAKKYGLKFLTGDKFFEDKDSVEFVK